MDPIASPSTAWTRRLVAWGVILNVLVVSLPGVGQAADSDRAFKPWGKDRLFDPLRDGERNAPVGDDAFSRMHLGWGDLAWGVGAFTLNIGLDKVHHLTPDRSFTPPALDREMRALARISDVGAADTASTVLRDALELGALTAPMIGNWHIGPSEVNAGVVGLEALLTTAAITTAAKHAAGRLRPDEYAGARPAVGASFFSGHTSSAFAAATMLTIDAYQYKWLSDDTRWLVPALSYGLAGSVGYLRMAADRHWGTDVLTGAAVGTLSAWLVYKLRTDWLN
jgi:membrane-associated phospholipid phosphatase